MIKRPCHCGIYWNRIYLPVQVLGLYVTWHLRPMHTNNVHRLSQYWEVLDLELKQWRRPLQTVVIHPLTEQKNKIQIHIAHLRIEIELEYFVMYFNGLLPPQKPVFFHWSTAISVYGLQNIGKANETMHKRRGFVLQGVTPNRSIDCFSKRGLEEWIDRFRSEDSEVKYKESVVLLFPLNRKHKLFLQWSLQVQINQILRDDHHSNTASELWEPLIWLTIESYQRP